MIKERWTGFEKFAMWFAVIALGLLSAGYYLKACDHWKGF